MTHVWFCVGSNLKLWFFEDSSNVRRIIDETIRMAYSRMEEVGIKLVKNTICDVVYEITLPPEEGSQLRLVVKHHFTKHKITNRPSRI